jgi:hypothetical protein
VAWLEGRLAEAVKSGGYEVLPDELGRKAATGIRPGADA